MSTFPFLTRVELRNYKSIAFCRVELGALIFLVGPNGAGKSNFLDALRFVADALNTSLDHAIRQRNGIKEVRRRSKGHPNHFSVSLEFQFSLTERGRYAFRIAARPNGSYEVQQEECDFSSGTFGKTARFFRVSNGKIESSESAMPAASPDRLYLVAASGLPVFRPVYDAFSHMAFYNLNPDRIRDLQSPDAGERLTRDGDNIASVLAAIGTQSPSTKRRIEQFLSKVVPGVQEVERKVLGPKETLEFKQQVSGDNKPWSFLASSMSDGTLRALGVLVALFQASNGSHSRVPLIGIEEPEVALHPAAVGALLDGLEEASQTKQILITSHSPDLLDSSNIKPEQLLAVVSEEGVSRIAPLDRAGREALRTHLYTPGELLRLNQLTPDPDALQNGSLFAAREEDA